MSEKLNVQPAPAAMKVSGEIDGVPILFESAARSWFFFDPAPAKREPFDFMNATATGMGSLFTVDEAVALVRVLVRINRRLEGSTELPSPNETRDSSKP